MISPKAVATTAVAAMAMLLEEAPLVVVPLLPVASLASVEEPAPEVAAGAGAAVVEEEPAGTPVEVAVAGVAGPVVTPAGRVPLTHLRDRGKGPSARGPEKSY